VNEKLENIIIKYLNKLYGDLKIIKKGVKSHIFYGKNNNIYMERDLLTDKLWINYDLIWRDLKNMFSLNYREIQSIINKWVEVAYNLKGVTPIPLG
jgi:hypothetical protein